MSFSRAPVVEPAADNLWRLVESFSFFDHVHGQITVKPGALTDGASIPRILWTLIGSPMIDSRVFRAAIIHDQLYRSLGAGQLTRAECDAVFFRALVLAGMPDDIAALYWLGVRVGGWVGWHRYAQHPEQVEHEAAYLAVAKEP